MKKRKKLDMLSLNKRLIKELISSENITKKVGNMRINNKRSTDLKYVIKKQF